jgi:hypothetical protein
VTAVDVLAAPVAAVSALSAVSFAVGFLPCGLAAVCVTVYTLCGCHGCS